MHEKIIINKSVRISDVLKSEFVIYGAFFLFSFFLIILLNLPWSPRFFTMTVDNGIFAYAGKLVAQGELPYRDFWDNIPPIINYINAMTFSISSPTPWAIWWQNIIWLSFLTIVLVSFTRKISGLVPSLLSGILLIFLVMDRDLFSGGNMTEFFSLLPQILSVWVLYKYLLLKESKWVVILGILTTLAFLTKQTSMILSLSSMLVILGNNLLNSQWRKIIINCLIFGISALITLGLVMSYWWINNGISEFINQVIFFNLFYIRGGATFDRLLLVLHSLISKKPFMYLIPIVIISYAHFIYYNTKRITLAIRKHQLPREVSSPINLVYSSVFIGLPIGILFIGTSIYNYYHYYTLLIPTIVLIIIYMMDSSIRQIKLGNLNKRYSILSFIILILLVIWLGSSINSELPNSKVLSSLKLPLYGEYPLDEMERYIVSQTKPQDTILIWDMHVEIYLRTNTVAPSRFIHPIPLLSASGNEISNFQLFMDDLAANPPVLIIAHEDNSSGLPFFDVPDDKICPVCLPEVQSGLRSLRSYVQDNYYIDTFINDWIIYKRVQ